MKSLAIAVLTAFGLNSCTPSTKAPTPSTKSSPEPAPKSGFIQIHEAIPNVVYDIRYFGTDNFVGAQVDGYKKATAYLSKEAVAALKEVQTALNKEGLGLKIFDAYRPQKAVDHFVRWGKDLDDTLTKAKYYPDFEKARLFELEYIAEKSGHTRGSTVDLTIIDMDNQEELDMGSPWDFFGTISNHDSPQVNPENTANRNKLRNLMKQYGFTEYPQEWWHYTLTDEPYPDTYFDFDVE